MISSKILVQSAAAGLMAGAILSMPIFLFDSDDVSFEPSPCEYERAQHAALRVQPRYRAEGPAFRAAPPVNQIAARQNREATQRSLDERNEAARQALTQLHKAYEHTNAQHRGAQLAHSVTLNTMARHAATRVSQQAFINCHRAHDQQSCQQLMRMIQQHGPLKVVGEQR